MADNEIFQSYANKKMAYIIMTSLHTGKDKEMIIKKISGAIGVKITKNKKHIIMIVTRNIEMNQRAHNQEVSGKKISTVEELIYIQI